MKKVFGCGGLVALVILAALIGASVSHNSSNSGYSEFKPERSSAAAEPTPAPKANGVTAENYEKLQTGMTQEQVAEILGTTGKEMSSSAIDTGAFKSSAEVRIYQAEGFMAGNITITYSDGKLMSKAQFGL